MRIQTSTPLERAAFEGDVQSVRDLLASDGIPREVLQAALVAAARAGRDTTVIDLMKAGASVNQPSGVNNWTPLEHAIHKHQLPSIRALVTSGADPNQGLLMAAGYGFADIVQVLVEHGADPRKTQAGGRNALDTALTGVGDIDRWTLGNCQTETVRLLIEKAPGLLPAATRAEKRPLH